MIPHSGFDLYFSNDWRVCAYWSSLFIFSLQKYLFGCLPLELPVLAVSAVVVVMVMFLWFSLSCMNYLYILDINPLWDIWLQYFMWLWCCLHKVYLFETESDRERDPSSSGSHSKCWQQGVSALPGQSQEPGNTSGSLIWVAEPKCLIRHLLPPKYISRNLKWKLSGHDHRHSDMGCASQRVLLPMQHNSCPCWLSFYSVNSKQWSQHCDAAV